MTIRTLLAGALALIMAATMPSVRAQDIDGEPIIDITDPNFEPVPIAIAPFVGPPELAQRADDIRAVVEANLEGSGLFTIIPREAYISQVENFDIVPQYADWRAINAAALITG